MTPTILRRCQLAIIVIAVVVALAMGLLLAACWVDDRRIDKHLGVATATVIQGGSISNSVTFVTNTGEFRSSPNGVMYPGGLAVGQRVSVEYDTTNPNRVRIAGRSWTLALWPVSSVVLGVWLVAALLMVGLAHYSRRTVAWRQSVLS